MTILWSSPIPSSLVPCDYIDWRLLTEKGAWQELNTVRQCVSRSKGGGLARAAAPATVVALIISDVVGDEMRTIASGPTSPSGADRADMLEIGSLCH